ncbi:MFS transporter [Glycomyces salinus]|uniref:MFS transporter n=1 Tax=Glycomyces salinus TaxID=980294 RepID=UPI001E314A5E|nr:MFS transporter [Glycomyces salinus]
MTNTRTPAPRRARMSGRQAAALAVLVLPVLLISVDMTVLGFAVPFLSADLAPSAGQLLWIVDVYGFMLAGLLVTMGSVADRIGRRRLLIIGAVAFAAASIAAAYAPTAEALIAARALLGLAGATLMPTTLALIRNIFTDERQRLLAIAIWGAGFSAGMAAGPIVGGWLLEHFWWGSVFLMAIPVTVVVLAAGPFVLPESRNPEPGPLDWPSVGLSFATMFPFVYGVKSFAEHGFSFTASAAVAAGLAFGAVFVARQRRLEHPLIDVTLFSRRRFSASVLTNFTVVFALISALFLLTQYLQLVLGLSPVRAGMVLLPGLVAGVVSGLVAVRLSDRFGLVTIIVGGLSLIATGFAALTGIGVDSGAVLSAAAFGIIGLGSGLVQTVTNAAVMSDAPSDRAGAAAAISETGYELGGALGVALLGSLASVVYVHQLGDAAEGAGSTLGEALETAAGLPAGLGASLAEAARTAFTTGLRATSVVGLVLLAIAAVSVGRVLRRRA